MEKCDYCGEEFEYQPDNGWDWSDYHFCSPDCSDEAYSGMYEAVYGSYDSEHYRC